MATASENSKSSVDPAILPQLPELDGVPGDAAVVQLVAAAHRGLDEIYETLRTASGGEVRLLAELLARDWRRLADRVRPAIDEALAGIETDDEVEARPTPEQVEEIVDTLKDKTAGEFLPAMLFVAERCCLASRFVPWTARALDVDHLFRAVVEAEDEHVAQVTWLNDLLGDEK